MAGMSWTRRIGRGSVAVVLAVAVVLVAASAGGSEEGAREDAPSPERGLRVLLEKAYLPPILDDEVFAELWTVWPPELRARAEKAGSPARRRMAFERYGLTARPDDDSGVPLQFVRDEAGRWSLNCFACHGGAVADRIVPGLPNVRFAFATLVEESWRVKTRLRRRPNTFEWALAIFPLGSTRGTTNAVMFGVAVQHDRAPDLRPKRHFVKFTHHDMDAPPFWHYRKKSRLYIDGFAPKTHRALMQFALVAGNEPAAIRSWEPDFRHVHAYLESLKPPAWPWSVDAELAARGETVFARSCASCHGTAGLDGEWPEKRVPLAKVGTDPVRLRALTPRIRTFYRKSWVGEDHAGVVTDPDGYVAPPLDGVWASAPYLHNGSVPTLWHLLHPDARPEVWRQLTPARYDRKRVGLAVEIGPEIPAGRAAKTARREIFDTRRPGKGAGGHRFPDRLTEPEKRAVLEFLKAR